MMVDIPGTTAFAASAFDVIALHLRDFLSHRTPLSGSTFAAPFIYRLHSLCFRLIDFSGFSLALAKLDDGFNGIRLAPNL